MAYSNGVFPGFKVDQSAGVEPLTKEQVKVRMNIDESDTTQDEQIESLIVGARQYIERYTKRFLRYSQVVEFLDQWPENRIILPSWGPVTEGDTTVNYYNEVGGLVNLTFDVQIDTASSPTRIYIPDTVSLPGFQNPINNIILEYYAGSPTVDEMPAPLIQAMYMLIGSWLENGSDQDITDLKFVHTILDQYANRK